MSPAPVALFLYNRLDHTRRTVAALQRNALAAQSRLVIFCDGARSPQDAAAVDAVRAFASSVTGFATVDVVERETNLGLAASIIAGVGELCSRFGRVIVLEDDLETAPFFLRYMNDALELYAGDERVIAVHGYMFPVGAPLPQTFFLRDPGCWGWATWQRGWAQFDADGARHLAAVEQQGRQAEFDLDGAYPYLAMLKDRIAGKNSSWAILWYASAFLTGKLTLYPGASLVRNTGLDGTGTHANASDDFTVKLADGPVTVAPIPVEEHAAARRALSTYLAGLKRGGVGGLLRRLATKVRG